MKRGRNVKPITITIDQLTMELLNKYRKWGTPYSSHVRRCVAAYEKKQNHNQPQSWDGVDVFDGGESSIQYD